VSGGTGAMSLIITATKSPYISVAASDSLKSRPSRSAKTSPDKRMSG